MKDDQGNEYKYTVEELTDLKDYTKEIKDNKIINTYIVETFDYTMNKVWENIAELDELPTIEIQLLQDGEPYKNSIELKDGETTYTWESLPKTDLNGNEYQYTVEELTELENFEVHIEGNTITNTYVKPKVEIPLIPLEPSTPIEKPEEPKEEIPLIPLEPSIPIEKPEDPKEEIPLIPLEPSSPSEKPQEPNNSDNGTQNEPVVKEEVKTVPTGINQKYYIYLTMIILSLLTVLKLKIKKVK